MKMLKEFYLDLNSLPLKALMSWKISFILGVCLALDPSVDDFSEVSFLRFLLILKFSAYAWAKQGWV